MKWTLLLSYFFMSSFGKIVSILGLTFVTYKGLDLMVGQFRNILLQNLSGFPSDALNILYIAGFGVCLNYFFGAFSFLVSFQVYKRLFARGGK